MSDAGRATTHSSEDRDCTVVALAHAANIPYADAHQLARRAGRKDRHGLNTVGIMQMLDYAQQDGVLAVSEVPVPSVQQDFVTRATVVYTRNGAHYRHPRRRGVSIAQFVRMLPKTGRFYLTCTTHAFAVVDGVILDNLNRPMARAIMHRAWRIVPAEPVQAQPSPSAQAVTASQISQAQINELWERMNRLEERWKR